MILYRRINQLILPILLMGLSNGTLAQDYTVTVRTFSVDRPRPPYQKVPLYCTISPEPEEAVIYSWRTSIPDHTILHDRQTSPYGSYQPFFNHPQFDTAYCYVMTQSDRRILGVGSITLETRGYIEPTRRTLFSLLPPAPLKLEAKISPEYKRDGRSPLLNIRVVTSWTHNGTDITPASHGAPLPLVLRTLNKLALRMNSTRYRDAGVYELQVSHFYLAQDHVEDVQSFADNLDGVHDQDLYCSAIIIDAIRLYAIFNPVQFQVYRGAVQQRQLQRNTLPKVYKYKFFENEPLELTVEIPLQSISGINYLSISERDELVYVLIYNGRELLETADREVSPHRTEPESTSEYRIVNQNTAHVRFTLLSPQQSDAGIYEYQFYVQTDRIEQELNKSSNSCNKYMNFLRGTMRLEDILIGTATLDIRMDDPPQIIVNASKDYFTLDDMEGSTLTCSVTQQQTGDVQELSWSKNGYTVATTRSPTLSLRTVDLPLSTDQTEPPKNVYGEYTCTAVGADGRSAAQSIHVSEKVSFHFQLRPEDGLDCVTMSTNKSRQTKLLSEMGTILSLACNCDITRDHFTMTTMSCDNNNTLTLTMDFVYSDSTGAVTATSVLRSAASWLMGERTINGDVFFVDISCPLRDSNGECIGSEPSSPSTTSWLTTLAILVAVLVGGFLAGIILTLILVGCIVRWKKRKTQRNEQPLQANTREDTATTPINMVPMSNGRINNHQLPPTNDPQPYSYPQVTLSGGRTQSYSSRISNGVVAARVTRQSDHLVSSDAPNGHAPQQNHTNEEVQANRASGNPNSHSNRAQPAVSCIPNPAYVINLNEEQSRRNLLSANSNPVRSPVGATTSYHIYDYPRFENEEQEDLRGSWTDNSDGYVI